MTSRAPRLLTFALAAILSLLVGCRPVPEQLRLVDVLSTARLSDIVQGTGQVGRPSFRGFLGPALRFQLDGERAQGRGDTRGVAFGFFLYRPADLTVVAVARARSPKEVRFFCTGHLLGQESFAAERTASFLIPEQSTHAGWNEVEVENADGVEFLDLFLRPAGAGVSTVSHRPFHCQASPQGDSIMLPFGEQVSFAIDELRPSRLRLQVKPWVEPGAATVAPEAITLRCRVMRPGQPDWERDVQTASETLLQLPPDLDRFALSIQACLPKGETALPGQAGVRLSAILEGQASGVKPSASTHPPSPTPAASGQPATPATNVVLIVIDTLRADRLSTYGYKHPTSPHLDALARDGVVFERVTAQAPWTKPTVASIMTGLEPGQHRAVDFSDHLEPSLTTMAESIRKAGYQTMAVVANPLVSARFGFDQGFDKFVSLPVSQTALQVNGRGLELLKKRDPKRPFFLYLQPIDPHLPYNPPGPFLERALSWHGLRKGDGLLADRFPNTGRRGFNILSAKLLGYYMRGSAPELPKPTREAVEALYDGEVALSDEAVGQVVAQLKEAGLYDNSMIIITADHGEEVIDRGRIGHTHTLFQELLHVPLVIKFPGNSRAGTRESGLYQQVDLLPTVLAVLGQPSAEPLDGVAYPELAPQRPAFFQVSAGRDAVEAGQAVSDYLELGAGLVDERWKLFHHDSSVCLNRDPRGLYDLKADPGERHNLVLEHPVDALFLERELARRTGRPSRMGARRASTEETRDAMRALDYLR